MGNACGVSKVGDQGRYAAYNDPPQPLSKSDIQKRIVCSDKTEIMTISSADCSFRIHHAHLTQRGYYPHDLNKANQDAFCSHPVFNGEENVGLWGVFDGHGGCGDLVSTFTKQAIPRHCIGAMKKVGPPSAKFIDASEEQIMKIHHKAFVATNKESGKQNFDTDLSGTTAITVMVKNNMMFVNNVGDSRAVVAVRTGKGELKAEHLR
jgi:cGMP-dependent protein kinase